MAPLNLQSHDVFLTVDLYEAKDPAQVLQCLIAFSRRASSIQPGKFPRGIGAKKGGVLSPQLSGSNQGGYTTPYSRGRGASSVSESGSTTFNPMNRASTPGRASPTKNNTPASPASPKGGVSSWSKKTDEGATAPAWNIHQYGYMGGASQGNQGISFGARRQITSAAPKVPSLADKERRRREVEAEEEKLRLQREDEEQKQRAEREAEEARAKAIEEQRWQEETMRLREKERREVEEEKKRWDEEQRRWEEEEERRSREEREAEERFEKERMRKRASSDVRLNGQFLSQYQAGQSRSRKPSGNEQVSESSESQRIKELERELELAKERERQYEHGRQDNSHLDDNTPAKEPLRGDRSRSRSRPRPIPKKPSYDLNSQEQEREFLQSRWQSGNDEQPAAEPTPPPKPSRPLPQPVPSLPPRNTNVPSSPRPLPDPANYTNKGTPNRTDRFLASNPAPTPPKPTSHRPPEFSSTAEIDAENARRTASTQKTRAGGWASKSLLEREMERERERQREWEENQKSTNDTAMRGAVEGGTAPGEGAWDVHQYGYLGGDSQNKGGPGLGIGGARRQIIGPRPPP